jgi:hypothetical protein
VQHTIELVGKYPVEENGERWIGREVGRQANWAHRCHVGLEEVEQVAEIQALEKMGRKEDSPCSSVLQQKYFHTEALALDHNSFAAPARANCNVGKEVGGEEVQSFR